jgi:NADH-quinone oxidoreductase subunit J
MLLIVVYVGAVAVLFLFVVMMLDVDFAELKAGFIKNAKAGALVGGVVLAELVALFAYRGISVPAAKTAAAAMPAGMSNTKALGEILYTKYVYFFQGSGMILLVAMIGAIVLTLRHREGVKRQSISEQVARNPKTAMEVIKVSSGGFTVPPAAPPKVKEAAE